MSQQLSLPEYGKQHTSPTLRPAAKAVRAILVGCLTALPIASTLMASTAHAQQSIVRNYSIAPGALGTALSNFAAAADITLSFDADQTRGKQSSGLTGKYSVDDGLRSLLTGSGLRAVHLQNGNYVLRDEVKAQSANSEAVLPAVNVSGSVAREPSVYGGGQLARGGRLGMLGDTDMFETPFNVTNYTAELVADRQATRISDIVKGDPSVQVVSPSLIYAEEFLVRGFRVTQNSITFDGMPGLIPNYGVGALQPYERVELLKGANTLLNGVSSGLNTGGNINLVPKRATDEPINQITTSYSSKSSVSAHVDLGRRFGENNEFGIRANVVGQNGDANFDDAREKRYLGTVALDYRGDRARVYVDLGTHRQRTQGAPQTLYPDAGVAIPGAPKSGRNYTQSWTYADADADYARIKAEYDITSNITAFAAYGGHDSKYEQVVSYGMLRDSAGNFEEGFQNGRGLAKGRTFQTGINATFKTADITHKIALSATQAKAEYRFYYPPDIASGALPGNFSNIYTPNKIAKPGSIFFRNYNDIRLSLVEEYPSYAISDTLSILDDRLLLTLGIRNQQFKTSRYDYDGSGTLTGTYNKSANTPVVGVLFKATSQLALYANYIESLQAGPTAPAGAINQGALPPAKNKQYELGAKYDFGGFGVSSSVFEINQPSGRLNPSTNIFALDGEQKNRGLEMNVFGQIGKNIRLNGGVLFLDAVLNKTENGAFDGKRVTGVAKTNISVYGEWDFTPAWTMTGSVLRSGSTYVDQANTQSTPSFATYDLGLRYRTKLNAKDMTLRANVANVANKSYFVADPFGGFYQGAPRTLMISATFGF